MPREVAVPLRIRRTPLDRRGSPGTPGRFERGRRRRSGTQRRLPGLHPQPCRGCLRAARRSRRATRRRRPRGVAPSEPGTELAFADRVERLEVDQVGGGDVRDEFQPRVTAWPPSSVPIALHDRVHGLLAIGRIARAHVGKRDGQGPHVVIRVVVGQVRGSEATVGCRLDGVPGAAARGERLGSRPPSARCLPSAARPEAQTPSTSDITTATPTSLRSTAPLGRGILSQGGVGVYRR